MDIQKNTIDCDNPINTYNKQCPNNAMLLKSEEHTKNKLNENPNEKMYLYPNLNDNKFNLKIALKKEFSDTKYDGDIYDIKKHSDILSNVDYELLPQQAFVKNFMSFYTPYNSLLLFHGLGSGKTCSAIGVCEEMRDYLKQMNINKTILIIASPNVQDNFKLQLFDERKLTLIDGIWTIKGCLGNKFLKEINPTGMIGLAKEKVIYQVKHIINASYTFQGYTQFSHNILRIIGDNASEKNKIRNLRNEYDDRLIVIDEVHNIRMSDENDNKNVAKNLMTLVSIANNLRLLLLSATPMFNNYKEIIWLLNLMNMNDRRGIVTFSDIFNKDGSFKKNTNGEEIGRELLLAKATGYISYVRGENPYTFPFRVYPNKFAPIHTFKNISEYPKYQLNGKKIPDIHKISKLNLYLNPIGTYQELGYNYIINKLRKKTKNKAFGYMDIQLPLEALIIVYPYDNLEEIAADISPLVFLENDIETENELLSIEPSISNNSSDSSDSSDISDSSNSDSSNSDINKSVEKVNISLKQKQCIDTKELNPLTNRCVNKCDIGKSRNAKFACVKNKTLKISVSPKQKQCTDAKELNPLTNKCVNKCDIGKSRDENFACVDNVNINKKIKKVNLHNHVVEGKTYSHLQSEMNVVQSVVDNNSNVIKGGKNSNESEHISPANIVINSRDLVGVSGLSRIMNFVDTKTPAYKGDFEYSPGMPQMFRPDEIGKYSSKIKNVCNSIYNKEHDVVSEGIILIYSAYLDGGLVPMALALEEMGFMRADINAKSLFKTPPTPLVDVRTMKPPNNRRDFNPASYAMITGDQRLSPNNNVEFKHLTNDDNLNGSKIKVVLISQSGSEGLDFKALRQIHILDPWYNVNRLEQIIGRGVRNFSHKDLPFEQRNVQIFLYGTILSNVNEESVDLYVYRVSEVKAVQIGKITRLLKEQSVDCIINHDQTQFTAENFAQVPENLNVIQILSDKQKIEHFEIGDLPNSSQCDYMSTCTYKCTNDIVIKDDDINKDTYNNHFMLVNSDKIIQKIKNLMKLRFFYKKNTLINLINVPKKYPIAQIYTALTQIINDNAEYLLDKYGRSGHLINIGDYYLFQPSELNYPNVSLFDRSVPLDFKHDNIKFILKDESEQYQRIDKSMDESGKLIIDELYKQYILALNTTSVKRGTNNWYEHCGVVIRKLHSNNDVNITITNLEGFLIEHMIDMQNVKSKIDMLNYLHINNTLSLTIKDVKFKRFFDKLTTYLYSKIITTNNLSGIVLFNGPSRVSNLQIYVLKDTWVLAESEDKKELQPSILKKYNLKTNLSKYVGFIGFDNDQNMIFKIKDTSNLRSTGFRCDQSGKSKTLTILNEIEETQNKYTKEKNKEGLPELCVFQELLLRTFELNKKSNKIWFLDTETAIINEFEKIEKPK